MSVERAINAPKLKRQKVAVACDPCRSRKVKCDGREPGKRDIATLVLELRGHLENINSLFQFANRVRGEQEVLSLAPGTRALLYEQTCQQIMSNCFTTESDCLNNASMVNWQIIAINQSGQWETGPLIC
ncbi:hypothetical protein B0A52_03721 [Exophiala mesophila]|uniref:Zn(2)-C6 fungal-type domain-containing protein n=1 Tax=Exophiala mesophila TaxID=212818 RepID=A0A438NA72_EXOME|nr:hypothetical protein B0A52_03721 [Exophiala mesophila]